MMRCKWNFPVAHHRYSGKFLPIIPRIGPPYLLLGSAPVPWEAAAGSGKHIPLVEVTGLDRRLCSYVTLDFTIISDLIPSLSVVWWCCKDLKRR